MFLTRTLALSLGILLLAVVARGGEGADSRSVWIISNGFHSAVAFQTSDAPVTVRGVATRARARWVAVGWGDKQFFMAKRGSLWITIQAVCWPTPSALHVIPLQRSPESVFRNSEIVRLKLRAVDLEKLKTYVEAAFARRGSDLPVYLGPGFSTESAFFLGSEKFYFPKMCNWWVAAGLRRAGVRIHPAFAVTSHELMRQLRRQGERVGGLRLPVDGF